MSHKASPLLRDNYHLVAKDLLSSLVQLMSVARSACDGDLDKYLILLVIGVRTAESGEVRHIRLDDVLSGKVTEYPSLYTNARSIADSTGIPRETVRRKVAALVAIGWVTRRGDDLGLTPFASQQLTPMREALFEMTGRMHDVVEQLRPCRA